MTFLCMHIEQNHLTSLQDVLRKLILYQSAARSAVPLKWKGMDLQRLPQLKLRQTDDIVGRSFDLKIKINRINNPNDWWFYVCTKCYKKMVLIRYNTQMSLCRGTEDDQRYKISLRAEDIHPTSKKRLLN